MIRYIPFLGGGSSGGGGGTLVWYYGTHDAEGEMSTGNAATDARDDFVAAIAGTVTLEDFEDEAVYEPSAVLNSTSITRNGVTMTFGNDTAFVTREANNGRFSTSVDTTLMLFCEATLYNNGVYEEFASFTFSPPIAAWGCFLTDVGDFSSGDSVYLELYKTGGGIETYEITGATFQDGNLIFIGFTDKTGTTYDEIRIRMDAWTGGGAAQTDGIGIDDIYWCEEDDIL